MATGGFPPYLQTDSQAVNYGLTNQLSPEAALKEQALNRRRAIANLLVQQGLQPLGGKMVGRFYVPDSPVQGLANLAKVGVGAFMTNRADKEQQDVAQDDQRQANKQIADYEDDKWHREELAKLMAQKQMAPPAAPAPSQGPPPSEPGIAPRPDGPYQGQVGAVPMPEPGVQSAAPPIPAQRPESIAGQTNMQGLDMNQAQPADMSQFAPPPPQATPAQPLPPSPAPAPTPSPMAAPGPVNPYEGLAQLMTSQHPQVRAYGAMLAQQIQQQQARDLAARQRQEDLAYKRYEHETPSGNALIGRDTQQAIANQRHEDSVAQLLQNQRADQQALELRRDQFNSQDVYNKAKLDLEKQQAAQRLKLDRDELALKGQQLQQGKTPPGYRTTKDGNLEAIPGGPADTKLQGVLNQDTAILNSSQAGLDRLASSANQIMNHPGLAGITGVRGKIPDIPGSNAADARALLEKLKSQVAFDVLQDMRNNSKTGGALGNVSDAEGKRLENNLAALNSAQSPEQFKRELQSIIQFTDQAKGRLREAFNMKHKTGEPMQTAPTAGAPSIGTIDGGYRFKGGDPSKPESWEKVQ